MMRFFKVVTTVLILGFVFAGIATAQTPLDLNSPIPLDKHILTGTLDNGMTYYIRKNETTKNRAELTIAVKAGAVLEDDDQLGLAHFCEHMAFNGTKNYPKHELVNYLESIGMKFGAEVNAYTSFDETVYGITVPLDSMKIVDKGLLVLSDWASNVTFEDEEIDKERGVIHEEWRMGQGAQDRMMRKYLPVLFHNSQYGKRIPIGTMEIIDKCPHDAIKRFYKDWYRPELMAVIAVGDFDEKVMETKIKELFSKIPKSVNPRERKEFDIPDHEEPLISIVTDKEAQYTAAQIFYKQPEFKQKTMADYKKAIAQNIYSSMLSKRLQELTIVADPPFMQGAAMYTRFLGPKDMYLCFAMTKNTGIERGLEAILLENERVKKFGFTATELDREKKSLMREMDKQYNERDKQKSTTLLSEIKNYFLSQEPAPGIEFEYEMFKKFLPDVKLEEINQFAKDWIHDKNMVTLIVAPEKDDVKIPTEEKVKEIIALVKTKELKPYEDKVNTKNLVPKEPTPGKVVTRKENKKLGTTEWVLNNGIKVVFKNTDFKKDEILFTATSPGGWSNCKQEDAVSAELAADVINESGLGDFDQTELQKYLSDKVANVSPYINELEEGMNGSCTPKDFETMMQLTYMYFTGPRKDEPAYKSFMEKQKAYLENKSTSPEGVWRDSVTCIMSKYNSRKRPMTVKLLEEANFKRIHYIYNQRFGDPSSFTFFFVGNVDLKVVESSIVKYLGGLPKVERTESFKDLGIERPKGKVDKVVNKGKEPKSLVFMNLAGNFEYSPKTRMELDFLTGVLNIKLIETIREDKSGVYTIRAIPQMNHYPKQNYNFTVVFPCSPDNVDKLSDGVITEIDKIRTNGPTEVDMNKVKEQKLRDRETNLRENSFWLNVLSAMDFDKEDGSAFVDYEKNIKALTVDKIKQAAVKYFDKSNYARIVLKPE